MPVFIKNIMAVFGAHSALIARNKKLPANEKISLVLDNPRKNSFNRGNFRAAPLGGEGGKKTRGQRRRGKPPRGRTSSRFRRTLPKRGNFAALPRACAFRSLQIALRLPRVRAPFRPARPRPKRCRVHRVSKARRARRNRAAKKNFLHKKAAPK